MDILGITEHEDFLIRYIAAYSVGQGPGLSQTIFDLWQHK